MQVAIAKNLENGEILELDDLTFQFVLWLNENKHTELDLIYAKSTLNTTVKDFKELTNKMTFEGEEHLLIPQINYFLELNTWVCFGKEETEEVNISFEISEVVYDKESRKESYKPIELNYLKPFLESIEFSDDFMDDDEFDEDDDLTLTKMYNESEEFEINQKEGEPEYYSFDDSYEYGDNE